MRLELTKRLDLAFRAMGFLNDNGSAADGRSIAAAIGTSAHYLPQVVKPLIDAGWISSTPGPGGGYDLVADLNDVSVLDIIESVEGPTDTGRCVLRGAPCPTQEECALHSSWVVARSALLTELEATSVQAAFAQAPTKGE